MIVQQAGGLEIMVTQPELGDCGNLEMVVTQPEPGDCALADERDEILAARGVYRL